MANLEAELDAIETDLVQLLTHTAEARVIAEEKRIKNEENEVNKENEDEGKIDSTESAATCGTAISALTGDGVWFTGDGESVQSVESDKTDRTNSTTENDKDKDKDKGVDSDSSCSTLVFFKVFDPQGKLSEAVERQRQMDLEVVGSSLPPSPRPRSSSMMSASEDTNTQNAHSNGGVKREREGEGEGEGGEEENESDFWESQINEHPKLDHLKHFTHIRIPLPFTGHTIPTRPGVERVRLKDLRTALEHGLRSLTG